MLRFEAYVNDESIAGIYIRRLEPVPDNGISRYMVQEYDEEYGLMKRSGEFTHRHSDGWKLCVIRALMTLEGKDFRDLCGENL